MSRRMTHRYTLAWISAALAMFAISSAGARSSGPPAEIATQIRAAGAVVDTRGMAALYGPLQEKEPYVGLRVTRDLSYGPEPQNLADVFTAVAGGKARPVLLFAHGGGFTAGARRMNAASPFYDNVGVWAARHGFVGVNMTYRLAPQAQWPAGAEDVGRAVAWIRNTIASQGGDPAKIFIMGHSAGATHVASYVSHPQFWGTPKPAVKGAIIISGTFDLTPRDSEIPDEQSFVERERAYFGEDASRRAEQASLTGLLSTTIPLLIVNAEYDPPFFQRRVAALKTAFQNAHRHDRFIVLPGHNHVSQILSINTADDGLTHEIEAFMRHAH